MSSIRMASNGAVFCTKEHNNESNSVSKGSNVTTMSNGENDKYELQLTVRTMNPYMRELEYAVRGPIVIRAAEIEQELAAVRSHS